MYFFYNRTVCGFLTTKGWMPKEQICSSTFRLLGFQDDKKARQVARQVYEKYGKTTAMNTVILKKDNLLKNKVSKIALNKKEEQIIRNGFAPLIQFLIRNQALQISSAKFFPSTKQVEKSSNKSKSPKNVASQEEPPKNSEKTRIYTELMGDSNVFLERLSHFSHEIEYLEKQSKEIMLHYEILLNEVESQIEDELHFVEFHKLENDESIKFTENLHNLRIKRRSLKDSLYGASLFSQSPFNLKHFKEISEKLNSLETRSYKLRSPDNFKH